MTLDEFCKATPATSLEIAEKLGVKGPGRLRTIQRYRTGERIPDRSTIRRIEEITGGKVTWDDWADVPVKVERPQATAA